MEKQNRLSKNKTADRIIFNTILVYAQKFSTAALALITTPLLLRVLGVEDYGVYTLTLGFVGMLTFFTWSLSTSTQRYIAVTLGEKNFDKLSHVLSSSLVIHLVYGILIIVLIQVVNFYYINDFLEIPNNRKQSIHHILTFVAGISFFNIIAIPFIGTLRATEDFKTIALIGIGESILKLLIAFMLLILKGDKLILFSGLMFLVSIISFLAYFIRVFKVKNSLYSKISSPQLQLVKEMLSFISWSILGAIAVMSRNQGVAVLLNVFYGVIANAAYGISQQINNALNILAQGVTTSISPILMKAGGEKNYEKMLYTMRTMAKLSFFSISIFSIPTLFEMPYMLTLWFEEVPPDSVIFSQLTIVLVLVALLSSGMQNVFVAIGKVKDYNINVSVILLLNLPISYLLFNLGYANYTIILVGILLEMVTLIYRLVLLRKYLNYKIVEYGHELVQILLPTFTAALLIFTFQQIEINPFMHLIGSFMISFILSPFFIYKYSLDNNQKLYVINLLSKFRRRIINAKKNIVSR